MSLVGDKCDKCRHCMRVYDNDHDRTQWVCAVLKETVKPLDGPCANYWGPEVGQLPYVPTDYPRLLNLGVMRELRLAVYQFGELLKALELQPRIEHPHDPGGELPRGQRR